MLNGNEDDKNEMNKIWRLIRKINKNGKEADDKLKDEKGEIITDKCETKQIIKNYYEKLYSKRVNFEENKYKNNTLYNTKEIRMNKKKLKGRLDKETDHLLNGDI